MPQRAELKERLKAIFKGPAVFHPPLFAAFPVLFLYAYNIAEAEIPVDEIWLPIVVSVAATLVLWAILSLTLRSLAKAGLATAIFLAFFFTYGRFYDGLDDLGLPVLEHAYLLAGVLIIWGCCVYFISRAKRDFRITTRWLNITAVVLIGINLFNIVSYEVKVARPNSDVPVEASNQTATTTPPELGALPDIYFIILDEYAHPDTMKEYYDYDNSEFINGLKDKGFFIASQSETRASDTPKCLAQILNMEYLDDKSWSDATYRKLAYSKVADFLKARGYGYIAFGSGAWLRYMRDSTDLYMDYRKTTDVPWISAFQESLWQTTMLKPFYYRIVRPEYENSHRRSILYTLEHLKMLPEREGPKFVFVHLNCPHEPFVFGPEGEYIDSTNWFNHEVKQFYLSQYIFISTQIEKVIDILLEKSETPPVIILQSDHGTRHGYPVAIYEWRKILNTMYLPGMDYAELSDSISPVNTFRLIFNYYFDTDYEMLPDD